MERALDRTAGRAALTAELARTARDCAAVDAEMITRARADELLEERFPVVGLFGVTDDERPRRLVPRLRLSTAPPRREP